MTLALQLTAVQNIVGALATAFPSLPVSTSPNSVGARYIRLDGLTTVNDLRYKNRESGTIGLFVHVIDKGTESLEWVIQTTAQIDEVLKEATVAGHPRSLQYESAEALLEPQPDESYDGHGIIRYRVQLGV